MVKFDARFQKLSNNGELIDYNNPPKGKWFDGIWQKDGVFYINETKFGTGKLTSLQKKKIWIQDNINKIPDPDLKIKIQGAFDAGELKTIVTHVDTNGVVSIQPWQ